MNGSWAGELCTPEEILSQFEITKESVSLALSEIEQSVRKKGHAEDEDITELCEQLQRIIDGCKDDAPKQNYGNSDRRKVTEVNH